jgi:hypothetical protein
MSKTYIELFVDGHHGVYVPQCFALDAKREQFLGVDDEQWQILESGPEHGLYWDVWTEVLDSAETVCGGRLHQDSDLWLVWYDDAIQLINDYLECDYEYETRHPDAGDNYSHMVAENWTGADTTQLIDDLGATDFKGSKYGMDAIGDGTYWDEVLKFPDVDQLYLELDPDEVVNLALECFTMQPGSIWGPYDGGIVLGSYPVGEIETQLDCLGLDGLVLDLVKDSCEAYINGDLAYQSTDAVWYAVLDIEQFNAAVQSHFNEESV